jgi:hypothetical protein
MKERIVILSESGDSVATVTFIAVLLIAAVIALFIWQPWNGVATQRFTTITTQQDHTVVP